MDTTSHFFKVTGLCAVLGLLASCGGGGGGGSKGDDDGASASASTGVFLDAEVAGVRYRSLPSGLSGTTNTDGEFQYRPGDTVTFSVGGIVLGSAPATGILTPLVLANSIDTLPEGVTAADVATNIAIFLQSFDSDGNPDNGITITTALATAAAALSLDFQESPLTFAADPTLTSLAALQDVEIVSPEDAVEHSNQTLRKLLSGSWIVGGDGGSNLAILNFYPDGSYAFGIEHSDPNCYDGVELGTYDIDSTTMQLTVDVSIDNTGPSGDCGLYEDGQSEILYLTFKSDSAIDVGYNPGDPVDSGTLTLTKINNSGINGSWTEYDEGGAIISVGSLLADGRYMISQFAGTAGVETGTWTRNASNVLTATPLVDTNGDAGLSSITPGTTVTLDSYGFLTFDVPDDGIFRMAPLPYRLKMPGNTASSTMTYSGCPSLLGGWDYVFNTTSMTWTGSDHWDSSGEVCTVGPDEVMTVPYTELDAPFACGSSTCDYHDLNKVIEGMDGSDRPFRSTYTHVPGSNVLSVVKTITGGMEEGSSWSETVVLAAPL